jgi:ABC-type transport system substrate-binding protein
LGDDGTTPGATEANTILRVGWTTDPDSLNPFVGIETSSYEIFGLNYDYLTSWDAATLETRPGLAESWTSSEDGKVWTFKLREGVTWHDGEPFTADDVVFTFDYIMDNELGMFLSFTTSIEDVTAVDETTVEFTCSQPKANMLSLVIPILPEHVWSKIDPETVEDSFQNPAPSSARGRSRSSSARRATSCGWRPTRTTGAGHRTSTSSSSRRTRTPTRWPRISFPDSLTR